MFAPLVFAFVYLHGRGSLIAKLLEHALIMLAIFLPFSYLVDSVVYRMAQKRHRRSA